jgi:Rod binding domain-containing protein
MLDTGLSPLPNATLGTSHSTSTGFEQLQRVASCAKAGEKLSEADLKEVGQKFEALLLHQMLSIMRKSIPKNELFGNSPASEMYQDMFDEKIAEQVASSGLTGIGENIVQEILRQQQAVAPPEGKPQFRPLERPELEFRPLRRGEELDPIPRKEAELKPIDRGEAQLRPLPGRLINPSSSQFLSLDGGG